MSDPFFVLGVGRGTKKANVHLLSTEDGCQLLAHVARQLSHQVAAHALLASDICPNKVSDCVEGERSACFMMLGATTLGKGICLPDQQFQAFQDDVFGLSCLTML